MPARCLVILVTILGMISAPAMACGLSWEKPHTHFDGVDEQGHVLFVDSLGDLDLGNDLKLPIYAMFNSNWQSSSPYLGQGWMLPLLESKIVQIDDNTFQLWQPDGWYQFMGRDKPTDTILNGQGGWKAEINGDTITAWASCGWKLTYDQGKITSITTPRNDVLEMIYRDGRIAEVREKGVPILKIETNPTTGIVSGLTMNGKTVALQEANKPQIQVLAGKNVIGSVASSLSAITYPDGTSKHYQFKVDDKIAPQLIADKRTIQWDPTSQLITRDNDWIYQITPAAESTAMEFTRTNTQGQSEYYFQDNAKGITTIQGIDGIRRTTAIFVNAGPLSGSIRSVTQIKDGISTVVRRYDYDENGKMIREFLSLPKPHQYTFKYDERGKQIEVDQDGKLFMKKDFDAQGRLIGKAFSNGLKETYSYLPDGIQQTTYLKNGETRITRLPNIITETAQSTVSSMTGGTH